MSKVVIEFSETDDDQITMETKFPDDYNSDNPRGYEIAALICIDTINKLVAGKKYHAEAD